jgi:hypothetical protein
MRYAALSPFAISRLEYYYQSTRYRSVVLLSKIKFKKEDGVDLEQKRYYTTNLHLHARLEPSQRHNHVCKIGAMNFDRSVKESQAATIVVGW